MGIRNLKAVQGKLKKLLARAQRRVSDGAVEEPMHLVLEAILSADSPRKQAAGALQALLHHFVDLNEMRIATPRDIAGCLPRDMFGAARKAESVRRALNAIFDRLCRMSLESLEKVPRREVRRQLQAMGLSPYASAEVYRRLFGGHAIPVDSTLVETLEMNGILPAGAEIEEVQALLERTVAPKDAASAHAFLRSYVEEGAKGLAARRRKKARADAKVAREAARAAKVKADAEAKAQAMAHAKAKIQARKAADRSAARKSARTARAALRRGNPKPEARHPKPWPRRQPAGERKDS